MVKDVSTGKTTTIYNAKEALSGLKTPIVKDPKVTQKFQFICQFIAIQIDTHRSLSGFSDIYS